MNSTDLFDLPFRQDAEKKGGKGMATTFLVLSIIGATGGIASVLFGWDPTGDDDDDDAPQVVQRLASPRPAPSGAHEKSFPRGVPMQHLARRRNLELSNGHLIARAIIWLFVALD